MRRALRSHVQSGEDVLVRTTGMLLGAPSRKGCGKPGNARSAYTPWLCAVIALLHIARDVGCDMSRRSAQAISVAVDAYGRQTARHLPELKTPGVST
jgi:hypothetical protein